MNFKCIFTGLLHGDWAVPVCAHANPDPFMKERHKERCLDRAEAGSARARARVYVQYVHSLTRGEVDTLIRVKGSAKTHKREHAALTKGKVL